MSEIVTHPIDWSGDDRSLNRLDVAHYNLAGQAIDWLSQAEIRGFNIPMDLALADAATRDAYGPWSTAGNREDAQREASWLDHYRDTLDWLRQSGSGCPFEAEGCDQGRYLHLPPSDESSSITDQDGS